MNNNKDKNLRLIGINADFVALHSMKPVKGQQGFSTTVSAQMPLIGLPSMQAAATQNIQTTSTEDAVFTEDDIKKLEALPSDSLQYLGQINSITNKYQQLSNMGLAESSEGKKLKAELRNMTNPAYLSYLKESKALYEKTAELQKQNTSSYAADDNNAIIRTNDGYKRVGLYELYTLDPSTFKVATVGEVLDYRARVGAGEDDLMGVVHNAGKKAGFLQEVAKSVDNFIGKADAITNVDFQQIESINKLAQQNIGSNVLATVKTKQNAGHKLAPGVKGYLKAVEAIYSDLSGADLQQKRIDALHRIQQEDEYAKLEKNADGKLTEESNRKLQTLIENGVYAEVSEAVTRALDPREISTESIAVDKGINAALGIETEKLEQGNPWLEALSVNPSGFKAITVDGNELNVYGFPVDYGSVSNRQTVDGKTMPISVANNPIYNTLLDNAFTKNLPVFAGGIEIGSPASVESNPELGSPNNFTQTNTNTRFQYLPNEVYGIDPTDKKKKPLRFIKGAGSDFTALIERQRAIFADPNIKRTDKKAKLMQSPEYQKLNKKYVLDVLPSVAFDVAGRVDFDMFGDNSKSNYAVNTANSEMSGLVGGLNAPSEGFFDIGFMGGYDDITTTMVMALAENELEAEELVKYMPKDLGVGALKNPQVSVSSDIAPRTLTGTQSTSITKNAGYNLLTPQ